MPDRNDYHNVSDIQVQQAVVEKIEKRIEFLKDQIKKANILAPCDGVVLTDRISDIVGNCF
jgi:hypothetical protein